MMEGMSSKPFNNIYDNNNITISALWKLSLHIVKLPPRWPGVPNVACSPLTLWPHLLHLDRLNKASSTNTRMWVASRPPRSIILYIVTQKKNL